MAALIDAVDATRTFGAFTAVDHVHLDVEAGEIVGLLGANGAGKTTLVRMILGLIAPSDGQVFIFGRPPSPAVRRQFGYVPQGLGLYDDLTPTENLRFARAVFSGGVVHRAGATRAGRPGTGKDAQLDDFPDRPVGQLSLGMQRRLAFAVALDHQPELLVLDEPTSGVGPLAAARLWETIRDTADDGVGALVTTHNLEEAEQCDRLVVMAAGRVVITGTLAEIIGSARSVVVTAGDWTVAFAALQRAGIPAALVGDAVRVPADSITGVRAALQDIPARFEEVPATLEERFTQLVIDAESAPT